MAIKVGINGFGRIGRVALRIMVERGSATYQCAASTCGTRTWTTWSIR